MCLTLPAKIITIHDDQATILDHTGATREVFLTIQETTAPGDWILVNANLGVQKVSKSEAEELLNLIKK